jgi:hypothetical protein
MAYNVPGYNTKRLSLGPGILYLGTPGTTPTVDVGATKGDMEIIIERKTVDVYQGSPKTKVATYVNEENVSIKLNGLEWNVNNLAAVLGAGITSQSGAQEIMDFGGDNAMSNTAVRYVHIMPDGSTIEFQMFKGEGVGKINIAAKESDMHEFPYEFSALEATVDFGNVAVAAKKKKFRLIRTAA